MERNGRLPPVNLGNGDTFEGEWFNGKMQGHGIFTWANGDRVHGQDAYRSARGWTYIGTLERDRPTEGVIMEEDGRRFKVTYDRNCNVIQNNPTPRSKDELVVPALGACSQGVASRCSTANGGSHGFGAAEGTQAAAAQRQSTGAEARAGASPEAGASLPLPSNITYEKNLPTVPLLPEDLEGPGPIGRGAMDLRPEFNKDEVELQAHVTYGWEWREHGTYVPFDTKQCVEIERGFRERLWGVQVWGMFPVGSVGREKAKLLLDFDDMTACGSGSAYVTAVRRWDAQAGTAAYTQATGTAKCTQATGKRDAALLAALMLYCRRVWARATAVLAALLAAVLRHRFTRCFTALLAGRELLRYLLRYLLLYLRRYLLRYCVTCCVTRCFTASYCCTCCATYCGTATGKRDTAPRAAAESVEVD